MNYRVVKISESGFKIQKQVYRFGFKVWEDHKEYQGDGDYFTKVFKSIAACEEEVRLLQNRFIPKIIKYL